jgi:hypothetical protein
MSSDKRLGSNPWAFWRTMLKLQRLTSPCTSTKNGRVPSMIGTTTDPDAPCGRSDRKRSDGLGTSLNPADVISKTPISLVEPNDFWSRATRDKLNSAAFKIQDRIYNMFMTAASRLPSLVMADNK